jgi:hypothetical protein
MPYEVIMVAIRAHYDGRVIVPDEPVNLPANQRVIVHLEPVAETVTDFRTWLGLGKRIPENANRRFRSDRDLWE